MRNAEQGGSIINISSIAGLDRGQLPGGHAYASSKAGVNTLTKVMSLAMQLFQIIGVIPLSFFVIVWKHNNYYKMKNHSIFIEKCTTEEKKPHTKQKKKFTSINLTIGKRMELTSFDSRKGQLKYISFFIKKKEKNYITKKISFKRKVRGLRIGTHQYASFLPFERKKKIPRATPRE